MKKYIPINSLVIEGTASNYTDETFTLTHKSEQTEDFSIKAVNFPNYVKEILTAEFKKHSEIKVRVVGKLICNTDCIQIVVENVVVKPQTNELIE